MKARVHMRPSSASSKHAADEVSMRGATSQTPSLLLGEWGLLTTLPAAPLNLVGERLLPRCLFVNGPPTDTLSNFRSMCTRTIFTRVLAGSCFRLDHACAKSGYRQMISYIDSTNIPSLRLHELFGFERVGLLPSIGFKFGHWTDTMLMQRALGLGKTAPPGELGFEHVPKKLPDSLNRRSFANNISVKSDRAV